MSRVFLSHSSRDNRHAIAVKAWLIEHEPGLADEIFLDLDPHTGIRPGERWRQALQQANARCEAVICLLSKHWEASRECQTEFRYAENLGKTILCARLEPVPDTNITSEWQRCDLFPDLGPTTDVDTADGEQPVMLDTMGLQRLLDALRVLGIGAEHFPWPPPGDPDRTPYRGWAPLDEADAAVFFGRDAQILGGLDVLHRMRTSGVKSLFVILGPSGAGKSSFLRAGLLPRLRRDDRRFLPLPIVRPERAALTGELGLAWAVHQLRTELGLRQPVLGVIKNACQREQVERLRGWLEEARAAARARLLDVPAEQPAPTLVLPVDQAEELFNPDAGSEASRFLEILAGLLGREAGVTPAMIVAVTIRADRYEPLQTAPELAELKTVVFDELKPMPPAGFKEVITGPARRASDAGRKLRIDPALVDRLLTETAKGADALPLLALTLERLYRDFGAEGNLTVVEYESSGGMTQVVQTEVDKLLAADPEQRRAQLDVLHDAFIPWLATINPDSDQPMRRVARWDDLPPASHRIIQEMVDKRLLVTDTRDGQTMVEVALESLLRQWRELAAWLREKAQDLKNADGLERAAADWRASGRDESWLLESTRLAEAETLAAKPGFRDRLDPARDFLNASRTREDDRIQAEKQRREAELQAAQQHAAALRKRSRILVTVLAVTAIIAVVAVVAGFLAFVAQRQAQNNLRAATAQKLNAQAQGMLARTTAGGDAQAFQEILASRTLTTPPDEAPLYSAVVQRASTLKIIAGHTDAVDSVAFSPNGKRIVSGSADKTVRLWDAETGKQIVPPLTGHTDRVMDVALSPDGHRIASASLDQTVRLWNADTGQPLGPPLTGHTGSVSSVAFSPDGHRLATAGANDDTVWLRNPDTGQPLGQPLTNAGPVMGVAFSPDGHRLATAGADWKVRLWNLDTGQPLGPPLTGHTYPVTSVAFSPDGRWLASASFDRTVRLWNPDTGQPLGPPLTGHTGFVKSLAFSPDGHQLATASDDGTIRLWDPGTGQPLGPPLTGHTRSVTSVAFSPDGHQLASASEDSTVRVWDAESGQPLTHSGGVIGVAFSRDGHRLASAGEDGTVRLWNPDTGQPLGPPLTGHTGYVNTLAFSPDGHRLAAAESDETVQVWNTDNGKPVGQPLTHHGKLRVTSVAFSPDGQRLATASLDGTVQLWNPDTGQPLGRPLTDAGPLTSVVFRPDGRWLASASFDRTVRLWNLDTGQPLGPPLTHTGSVYSVAFSPDGHRLATGSSDATVRLWNADTGQPLGPPLTGHTGSVSSVAFSPDGHRLASGSSDATVRLWNADTGQPLGPPLTGHTGYVNTLAFSPDGHRLATGSEDTVQLWPAVASPDMLCAKLTTNMSHKQWRDWVSPNIDYIKACPGLPIADDG